MARDWTVKRQAVAWVPYGDRTHLNMRSPGHLPIDIPERPRRVWTLFLPEHTDESTPPALPIVPVHNQNAFIEDYIHDWDWRAGVFRYASRVSDCGVWILLEYDK